MAMIVAESIDRSATCDRFFREDFIVLVNGQWQGDWNPYQKVNGNGEFIRQTSSFRHWITPDGSAGPTGEGGFRAEPGRYHLYVALICPWASRTLMVRQLKKLDSIISVSIVEPVLTDQGWRFASSQKDAQQEHVAGATPDVLHQSTYIHELYTRVDPQVSGRATVPVLWDKQRDTIVNNESADIIQMLNRAFDEWGDNSVDLRPAEYLEELNNINSWLYNEFNNGVYKAGFAKTQAAYEEAVTGVFNALSSLENRLADGREFLLGTQLTEADVRAFVTLIRFDVAYHGVFKCNRKRISDYPFLQRYVERIYTVDGIADTVNVDHIKQGYYSVKALNPNGIVPVGPELNFIRQGTSNPVNTKAESECLS